MLEDPSFWPEAQSQEAAFKPRKKRHRQYLSQQLGQAGGFAPRPALPGAGAPFELRLLNRLVIQDLLKTEAWERAFSLDQMWWSQWEVLLKSFNHREDVPTLFRKAGYELVQEPTALNYHRVWEFKPAN